MATYQFIYDDFNDNSIDSTRWSNVTGSSGLQTETSGKLNTPCAASTAATRIVTTRNWYDLRKGRLAIRYTRSGTTNGNVYAYWGLRDINNNWFTLFSRSSDANMQMADNTAGTGTATQVESTIGMGPSWTNNHWVGWNYTEATKTYSLGKSSDGVTWTEIYKYVVTTAGAFNPTQVGFMLGCSGFFGNVTNFTPQWDDASYFATDTALKTRVRFGGSWVYASPKVRVDGAWKRPIGKIRSGTLWVRPQ